MMRHDYATVVRLWRLRGERPTAHAHSMVSYHSPRLQYWIAACVSSAYAANARAIGYTSNAALHDRVAARWLRSFATAPTAR